MSIFAFDWETDTSAATRHTQVMNQLSVVVQALQAITANLSALSQATGKIMTDITDLTAAVTALQTAVTTAVSDIEAELAKIAAANTGNDPAIAQAVTNIQAATAALTAEHAKVVPPPV